MYVFRWNAWNVEHVAQHGVAPDEVEYALNHARSPYPRSLGAGKFVAIGQTLAGTYVQVVYVFDPPDTVFVIHARPLREHEKRR